MKQYAIGLYEDMKLVETVTLEAESNDEIVDEWLPMLTAYGQADAGVYVLDAAGEIDEWHVETTYDNGPTSVSEVMNKQRATEHAELLNSSPHVSVVVVRRCRGEWCFDCTCCRSMFASCDDVTKPPEAVAFDRLGESMFAGDEGEPS